MKKIISILGIFLLLTGCMETAYKTIDSNEAKDLIDNGAIIIDVREENEFSESHIPGAINVPLGIIYSVDYDKDTAIILYCATGVRSSSAAKVLHDNGYMNVYNLDGGLINWGFELEE